MIQRQFKDGSTEQDKLDFWLHIGMNVFLMKNVRIESSDYDERLRGNSLKYQQTVSLPPFYDEFYPKVILFKHSNALTLCLRYTHIYPYWWYADCLRSPYG